MNEVIKCMLERRSIRKYRPEQITEDELDAILLAGIHAPSAGNRQSVIIAVCQNEKVNFELGRINRSLFKGKMSTEKSYISKEQPSIADEASIPSAFYGAPTVLTLFAPRNFLYSVADCCVMAQNIMLAAHSVGVGSCFVARAEDAFLSELGRELQKQWGVDESYEARVHITLGYPDGTYPNGKPRKENRIKRIS
ncbi:MAG: nitroreductase family protein [Desulfomonile tiedjei]|uniref:Nitroreductase family protein n=1 Tax=Desulfomonile tiedjei TaxID=2358 RepID=A0A9D6V390_9BACT|nr:nitroreductase family protein [Desulfomonile tiedjei]